MLTSFVDLCADLVIPPALDAVRLLSQFERLESFALETLVSIVPVTADGDCLRDFLTKYTREVTSIRPVHSWVVIRLFDSYAEATRFDESLNETVVAFIRNALHFAEFAISYESERRRLRVMLWTIISGANPWR
jgi:hypothetical protein